MPMSALEYYLLTSFRQPPFYNYRWYSDRQMQLNRFILQPLPFDGIMELEAEIKNIVHFDVVCAY